VGKEAQCTARVGRESAAGKALLETDHLIFRGGTLRLKVPLQSITSVLVRDGALHVRHADGEAVLELGAAAQKWADAIANPRTLLDKLGVKQEGRVVMLGVTDEAFIEEVSRRAEVGTTVNAVSAAYLVFIGADDREALDLLPQITAKLGDDAGLWVIAPKGQKHIREMDVLNAGRNAGLTDVKVARFSDTHTAHKFVKPLGSRKNPAVKPCR
jgi:hypothetical protein